MAHYDELDKPDDVDSQIQWLEALDFEIIQDSRYDRYWTHFKAGKNSLAKP